MGVCLVGSFLFVHRCSVWLEGGWERPLVWGGLISSP